MAIEFNCPYCTAVIRVSGDAAGKIGRCPKCETRLRVPSPAAPPDGAPSAPPPAAAHGKPKPPPPPEEGFEAIDLSELRPDSAAGPGGGSDSATGLGSEPDTVFIPDVREPDANPLGSLIDASDASEPVYQRVSRDRRRNWAAILTPLICGGILVAAGVAYWWTQRETMTGDLSAERLPPETTPTATIQRYGAGVSTETWQAAVAGLAQDPVTIRSDLMVIEIGGSRRGIEVSVSAGAETTLVRVDVRRNRLLNQFLIDQSGILDAARAAELQDATTRFLEDWETAAGAGMLLGNGPEYQDSVGLNALRGGLGYHSVALAGHTLYPCVHEDSDGRLYFCLPHDVEQFVVTEREIADQDSVFPGAYRFTVRIAAPVEAVAEEPAVEESAPAEEETAEEPGEEMEPATSLGT